MFPIIISIISRGISRRMQCFLTGFFLAIAIGEEVVDGGPLIVDGMGNLEAVDNP
jgi:hypothetical protein